MPERDLEPPYLTAQEEKEIESAQDDRKDSINLTREQLLDLIHAEEEDVYEWDGDVPDLNVIGAPDYADEEKCFYYRHPVYVRAILKDGRIYYMTDGEKMPTFEKHFDPADLTERTEG